MLFPAKDALQLFGTSGAVRKMWFHTAATAPLFNGLTVTVAVSVFAIVEPVFGLREYPVDVINQVEAGTETLL